MMVIPAIDLRGGRCVRLTQGDFERETVFDDDPVAVARQWVDAGASWLHLVDLDGARSGKPAQIDVIRSIVAAVACSVQVGGGIRDIDHAGALISSGVQRIIVGTAALENPDFAKTLIEQFGPERVIVGVDARDGYVATHGWLETSDVRAIDLVRRMMSIGVQRVVYTDIDRDGTLTSPNVEATAEIAASGVAVIASGGVARRADLDQLAVVPGVEAAIVGRALYTGAVELHGSEWSSIAG